MNPLRRLDILVLLSEATERTLGAILAEAADERFGDVVEEARVMGLADPQHLFLDLHQGGPMRSVAAEHTTIYLRI